ncbi:SapC family protein [Limnohabitans sp.]
MTTPSKANTEFTILHREAHRLLKFNRLERDMNWVRGLITVNLAASEMPSAALAFPCVMTHSDTGGRLLAIAGLEQGRNLFVDAQGHWTGGYLPAVLRTWPFRLLDKEDDQGARPIAVQREALNLTEGEALFDEQGREMPWLKGVMQELVALDAGETTTSEMVNALHAAGVLTERALQAVLPNGRQMELTGFLSVDEHKLHALEDKVVADLHRQGALAMAYLHLLSLRKFKDLMELAVAHEPVVKPEPGAPAVTGTAKPSAKEKTAV